jgi:hypothetical protein
LLLVRCALDAYVKDTKCFACRVQTHGIFNTATKLIAVIKQRVRRRGEWKRRLERDETTATGARTVHEFVAQSCCALLVLIRPLQAATGKDPRLEIERLEKARLAEKEAQATGEKWLMPGRTAGL